MTRIAFFIFLFVLFVGNIVYVLVAIVFQKNYPIINSDASLSSINQLHNPPTYTSDTRESLASSVLGNSEIIYEPSVSEGMTDIAEETPPIDAEEQKIPEPEELFFTNDTFFPLQHYLEALNVPAAWNKVHKSNTVIVAVIDDGVNINHPDLTNSIWIEKGSAYGSNKIKDFAGDDVPNNFPTGRHGTMVAGII